MEELGEEVGQAQRRGDAVPIGDGEQRRPVLVGVVLGHRRVTVGEDQRHVGGGEDEGGDHDLLQML